MDAPEFLFVHDSTVTEAKIRKVLLIGSGTAQAYLLKFRAFAPNVVFDWAAFTDVTDVAAIDESKVLTYELLYIFLPLHSILTARVSDYYGALSESMAEVVYLRARQMLKRMLTAVLECDKRRCVPIYVANFQVTKAGPSNQFEPITDLMSVVRRLNNDLLALAVQYPNAFVADVNVAAPLPTAGGGLGDNSDVHSTLMRKLLL